MIYVYAVDDDGNEILTGTMDETELGFEPADEEQTEITIEN